MNRIRKLKVDELVMRTQQQNHIDDAAAEITDNSGGVDPGNDTIAVVTNPDLSAWNGATYPSAAEATAVVTALTAIKAAVSQLAAELNETSAAVDAILDALENLGFVKTS